jgi:hypothetical protein
VTDARLITMTLDRKDVSHVLVACLEVTETNPIAMHPLDCATARKMSRDNSAVTASLDILILILSMTSDAHLASASDMLRYAVPHLVMVKVKLRNSRCVGY